MFRNRLELELTASIPSGSAGDIFGGVDAAEETLERLLRLSAVSPPTPDLAALLRCAERAATLAGIGIVSLVDAISAGVTRHPNGHAGTN